MGCRQDDAAVGDLPGWHGLLAHKVETYTPTPSLWDKFPKITTIIFLIGGNGSSHSANSAQPGLAWLGRRSSARENRVQRWQFLMQAVVVVVTLVTNSLGSALERQTTPKEKKKSPVRLTF